MKIKTEYYKTIALILSLCTIFLWFVLGTGASLAWFSDTSPEINNIFHFADFSVEVSHRLSDGTWKVIEGDTKIFDENALYEPGYVQLVYLKVKNTGDRAFEFHTAVNVNGCVIATNAFGQQFSLQDYLRFGINTADNEEGMIISNREKAKSIANMKLHNYHTDTAVLQPNEEKFIAVVVRMPEEVDNIANYRGDTVPKVELGITVRADQLKK